MSAPQVPKLIGARIRRKEDPRLITGTATYVDDITKPGMLYAALLRSPYAAAKINSISVPTGSSSESSIPFCKLFEAFTTNLLFSLCGAADAPLPLQTHRPARLAHGRAPASITAVTPARYGSEGREDGA